MTLKSGNSKLKRIFIVLILALVVICTYVEIVNRNSLHMSYRQKLLKAAYPALMWFNRLTGKNVKAISKENIPPVVSFYSLKGTLINGNVLDLADLKGKKVMLLNTASDCGYTDQYTGLEKLYRNYQDKLVMIGFPSNDFKDQEKGSDDAIAKFCKQNYGVTFLLMKKSSVIKGETQNEIFRWLTDAGKNGWNDQEPTWNFCKYIVNENGHLTHFFASGVDPMSSEIINAITK